jgi:hypothetical protein
MLAGGLALQVLAFALRDRVGQTRMCLAAHAGCALTMPIGISLCALALPVPVMLVIDALLAIAVSSVVLRMRAADCR